MADATTDDSGFIDVESAGGNFKKFAEIGAKANGKLIGVRKGVPSPLGKTQDLYDFLGAEGGFTVAVGPRDLGDKLSQVPIGSLVRIEFIETKQIKGRPQPLKLFHVSHKRAAA